MDYGKLAYLKADELESRLNDSLKASKNSVCTDYTVNPVFDFKCGDYPLSEIRADGSVTLFVRMTVRADSDITGGEVKTLINGLKAGGSVFGAASGNTVELFVMCAINVSGTASVSLSSDSDCTLMSCQLLLSGEGAAISGRGGDSAADCLDGKWALVTSSDDYVNAYLFTEENFTLANPVYIGTGRRADVAAGKSGFCIAFVDAAKNPFLTLTDPELNVISTVFAGGEAERVAVAACGDGFVFATLSDGKIAVRYVDAHGGMSEPEAVDVTGAPERISFVKAAERPELIVYADKRSYLKCAPFEHGGSDVIDLTAGVTLLGTD